MRSDIFFKDSAFLAFLPLINLTSSGFENLSSRAALDWLLSSSQTANQWGAFMHLYGPTRKLLKTGGLPIEEESFLKMDSPNQIWCKLKQSVLSGALDVEQNLFFIRLLLYLGFYDDALTLNFQVQKLEISPDQYLWALYLEALTESLMKPFDWKPYKLIQELKKHALSEKTTLSRFHAQLLISKFFISINPDFVEANKLLQNAKINLETYPHYDGKSHLLGLVRLNKYLADLHINFDDFKGGESHFKQALALSEESENEANKNTQNIFLIKETKRRVLSAYSLFALEKLYDQPKALKFAEMAVQIDPFCSNALAFAGKLSQKSSKELASTYFHRANKFGIIERNFVNLQRQAIGIKSRKATDLKSNSRELLDPFKVTSLRAASAHSSLEELRNQGTYHRYISFWELKRSVENSPIFCNGPLLALQNFMANTQPWFETLYLQRAMPSNFREELLYASSPHTHFALERLLEGTSLQFLKNRSDETDLLIDSFSRKEGLDTLQRSLLGRALGSLGFYKEGLEALPPINKASDWEPEDEYAFCTKLFLENVFLSGLGTFNINEVEYGFNKLSHRQESLRMKLMLTVLAVVHYGKKKDISSISTWRERGFKLLSLIQDCSHFNLFEKTLLTSRFYRAMSYFPFLKRDDFLLRQETNYCESNARELFTFADDQKKQLLALENLFPALESVSRIYNSLGEKERAEKLMEEIIEKVDPHDSKAWIQLGDLREKRNDYAGALDAFQRAGLLQVPLGGLAWFRAGRVAEKLGDKKLAEDFYMNSLHLCPRGITPLKRLSKIATENSDDYLKAWSTVTLQAINDYHAFVS